MNNMPHFHKLSHNPFFEKHNHKLVGESRNILLNSIQDEIESALDASSPFITILLGAVGVGKSFSLRELNSRLNDPTTFKNPKKTVSIQFDATLAGTPSRYIEYMIHSCFRGMGKRDFSVLRDEFESSFAGDPEKLDDFFEGVSSNFRSAFLEFLNLENQTKIWNWLIGEKTDARELKKLNILSKIDDANTAMEAFSDLTIILNKLNYSGLILCIDEAEELALSGTSQVVKALTQLKKVYELNKNQLSEEVQNTVPIVFCLSFTFETYNLISGSTIRQKESARTGSAGLQTFLRRVGREFFVDPFSKDESKEFIKTLLNKARKEEEDNITPFSDETVEYLADISGGVPSYLMGYALTLLKIADDKEEPEISLDLARGWLIEEGMIPEEGMDATSEDAKVVEI